MRNLRFVHYSAVLLGLVVLRTKAQNGFCPMCTKGCCMVPTCSKPFWGQFWGQICKTDSHTHQSNKCAALVSLRNTNTLITGFLHRKRPHELMMKFYSLARSCTQAPLHTIPARRPCCREKRPCLGAFAPHRQWVPTIQPHPKAPLFVVLYLCPSGFMKARLFSACVANQVHNLMILCDFVEHF